MCRIFHGLAGGLVNRTIRLVAGCLAAAWVTLVSAQSAPQQNAPAAPAATPRPTPAGAKVVASADSAANRRALVNQYCVTCHNAKLKTANLLLDELDVTKLHEHPAVAERIVR